MYINLFSQKAFKYEGGKQIQVDLPDIGHRFQGLIEAMSEAIAETDDELMEKFFGGEPFTTEEIVEGMRKGVKDGLITPVFCGSAVNMQALDMLLFNMHKLLPSPEHEASTLAEDANGEPVELHCTEDEPTAAYVFKTVADPFVGKLSYLRVISGKVTAGEPLTNARTGEVEKITKPLTVLGKKQIENDGIGAGDIGAVAKLVSAKTGDTLCDADRVVKLPAPVFPKPSLFMAVTVAKKGDEGKISSALARLMEEDPTLCYINNAETHQQVIGGLGEQHLDVVKAKLKNKFGVEIGLEAPRIAYSESIRKACQKQGRHKKPVSYSHLDVYKRQHPFRAHPAQQQKQLIVCGQEWHGQHRQQLPDAPWHGCPHIEYPVSYTHLDVYKRQTPRLAHLGDVLSAAHSFRHLRHLQLSAKS